MLNKLLDNLFAIPAQGSNIRRELLAGLTTFLTMAYIMFLQPAILSTDFSGNPTGMDFGAVFLATCLSAGLASIFMGIYANYPIALAPGMGENFFFVAVIGSLTALGYPNAWQVALGIVVISGVLFFLISIFPLREIILRAISPSMRHGITVGIGLFITLIGFQRGHLIVAKPGTMVGLNTHFFSADIGIFCFGLLVTAALWCRKARGAVLWGILSSALMAFIFGKISWAGAFGLPQIKQPAAFQMDLAAAVNLVCLPFIFVFLFMTLFDTIGTLIGVADSAGLMPNGKLPRLRKVFIVDSAATMAGACLGTSTVTSYIESAAGVAAGGRTGLTSVTAGMLFIAALFVSPLAAMIGKYDPITAPALVIVGLMMMSSIRKIDWEDATESLPAFLTLAGIPLCYSISDGLALGFICYPILKICSGRIKEVSWFMIFMALILVAYFLFIRTKLG